MVQATHPYNSEITDGGAGPLTILPVTRAVAPYPRSAARSRPAITRHLGFTGLSSGYTGETFLVSGRSVKTASSDRPEAGQVPGLFILRNRNQ